MECNRDEAIRAKQIAEKKFTDEDIKGAKRFALKAQTLFPEIEGIAQMLQTLDVYITAENEINGEADWYGVLKVDPKAEEDTIRKQYADLVLQLNPAINKSIGAEGALELISKAWTFLSDKSRRKEYDERRTSEIAFRIVPSTTANGDSSAECRGTHTYWTECHNCKKQYEYLCVCRNCNLVCRPMLNLATNKSIGAGISLRLSEQNKTK